MLGVKSAKSSTLPSMHWMHCCHTTMDTIMIVYNDDLAAIKLRKKELA
eukprot:COSAG02_NODE_1027_length_15115_cov_118.186867_3_plen_48_part_00